MTDSGRLDGMIVERKKQESVIMIPDDCAFLFAYRKKLAGKRLTEKVECQPLVETWPDKK